jgi:hypothetical protein
MSGFYDGNILFDHIKKVCGIHRGNQKIKFLEYLKNHTAVTSKKGEILLEKGI